MEIQTDFRKLKSVEGNEAVAHGVRLCQPDVIAAYPITPMSSVLDYLYEFHADGQLRAEMIAVESEHSAMSALMGASLAGGRTFTATASQGLLFMYEAYLDASTLRLPIVMSLATRETNAPQGVTAGDQDAIQVKDGGWIQIHVESGQEILDTIIMAYRLAEDPSILLPVMVCYTGFYLSYLSEPVEIPDQEKVDQFLPPLKISPRLDPKTPMTASVYSRGVITTEYRYKHLAALQRAKSRIDEIDDEFQQVFGRSYGGQVEEYRCEDADIVLLTMGSCAGTAKDVIDEKRDRGLKVGLIKVRMFSPFPGERLGKALTGKKAVGVIDRNVAFGWNCGSLFIQLKAACADLDTRIPRVNFIGGLSGSDITMEHIARAIDVTQLVAEGKPHKEVTWLSLE
jgi:pyruvate/2-oxoacid:ferredoxin oxidoreductase alpha subunit